MLLRAAHAGHSGVLLLLYQHGAFDSPAQVENAHEASVHVRTDRACGLVSRGALPRRAFAAVVVAIALAVVGVIDRLEAVLARHPRQLNVVVLGPRVQFALLPEEAQRLAQNLPAQRTDLVADGIYVTP